MNNENRLARALYYTYAEMVNPPESGPNKPAIYGLERGTIEKTEAIEWQLCIGPLTNTRKPGQAYEMSNYSIRTAELGELLKLSINVEHGK